MFVWDVNRQMHARWRKLKTFGNYLHQHSQPQDQQGLMFMTDSQNANRKMLTIPEVDHIAGKFKKIGPNFLLLIFVSKNS